MPVVSRTVIHRELLGANVGTAYRRVFATLDEMAEDATEYQEAETIAGTRPVLALVADAGAGTPRTYILTSADPVTWSPFSEFVALQALQVQTTEIESALENDLASPSIAKLKDFVTAQWSSADFRTQPLTANVPNSACSAQVATRAGQVRREALFDVQDRNGASMTLEVWVNGVQRGLTRTTTGDGARRIYSVGFSSDPIIGAALVTLYVRTGSSGGTYRLYGAQLVEVSPE